jgi:hypothetical protein
MDANDIAKVVIFSLGIVVLLALAFLLTPFLIMLSWNHVNHLVGEPQITFGEGFWITLLLHGFGHAWRGISVSNKQKDDK